MLVSMDTRFSAVVKMLKRGMYSYRYDVHESSNSVVLSDKNLSYPKLCFELIHCKSSGDVLSYYRVSVVTSSNLRDYKILKEHSSFEACIQFLRGELKLTFLGADLRKEFATLKQLYDMGKPQYRAVIHTTGRGISLSKKNDLPILSLEQYDHENLTYFQIKLKYGESMFDVRTLHTSFSFTQAVLLLKKGFNKRLKDKKECIK